MKLSHYTECLGDEVIRRAIESGGLFSPHVSDIERRISVGIAGALCAGYRGVQVTPELRGHLLHEIGGSLLGYPHLKRSKLWNVGLGPIVREVEFSDGLAEMRVSLPNPDEVEGYNIAMTSGIRAFHRHLTDRRLTHEYGLDMSSASRHDLIRFLGESLRFTDKDKDEENGIHLNELLDRFEDEKEAVRQNRFSPVAMLSFGEEMGRRMIDLNLDPTYLDSVRLKVVQQFGFKYIILPRKTVV